MPPISMNLVDGLSFRFTPIHHDSFLVGWYTALNVELSMDINSKLSISLLYLLQPFFSEFVIISIGYLLWWKHSFLKLFTITSKFCLVSPKIILLIWALWFKLLCNFNFDLCLQSKHSKRPINVTRCLASKQCPLYNLKFMHLVFSPIPLFYIMALVSTAFSYSSLFTSNLQYVCDSSLRSLALTLPWSNDFLSLNVSHFQVRCLVLNFLPLSSDYQ